MNNNKKEKIMKYAIVASTIFTLSVLTLALAKPQTAAATTTTTITSQPDSIVTGKTTFLPWYGDGGVITFLPYYANDHGDGITLIPQTQPMSDLSGV
jgi:hypothetical protein